MRRNILLERHRLTVGVRLALKALHVEAALLGEKAQQLEGRRAGGVQACSSIGLNSSMIERTAGPTARGAARGGGRRAVGALCGLYGVWLEWM